MALDKLGNLTNRKKKHISSSEFGEGVDPSVDLGVDLDISCEFWLGSTSESVV